MMSGFTDKFIIETVESSGHIIVNDEPRETETAILQMFYKNPNAVLTVDRLKPREQIKKIKNPELDREFELLEKCKAAVEENRPLRNLDLDGDDEKRLRGFQRAGLERAGAVEQRGRSRYVSISRMATCGPARSRSASPWVAASACSWR